jgi:hypothetical protein
MKQCSVFIVRGGMVYTALIVTLSVIHHRWFKILNN